MKQKHPESGVYTQNRELSWLRFNDRVLDEAAEEQVPLLERLKFAAIFFSNLDEFFMIRVGSLDALTGLGDNTTDKKSGMTPAQQLEAIYEAVRPLYAKHEEIFQEVDRQLRLHDVYQLAFVELAPVELKYVRQYYRAAVAPILSPQIIDTHHPFPHLQNKVVHVGARLVRKGKEVFGVIPLPASLPQVIYLPGSDLRCIRTEDLILDQLADIFTTYAVEEKTAFCVTRNADVNPDDEAFDFDTDFRKKMKKALGKRRRLDPVRLEVATPLSQTFLDYLCQRLEITSQQVYETAAPFKMNYVFDLAQKLPESKRRALIYPAFIPQPCPQVKPGENLLRQLQRRDLLLSFPYESADPFLRLVREGAMDPAVVSIKITIYRLASKAKLVDYLCTAAENGKDVTAIIELRARFDEESNINWSERLEEAGCTVIYGFESYKIHSKICLITRRERGEVRFFTQVGTGNYNEKTAAMYTDVSLMTSDPRIGRDANEFFKNMAIGNLEGEYRHLLVAPKSLKSTIIQEIDREIRRGDRGRILMKMNSITDLEIIEKLKQAYCAGVRVQLIIRGICCILPGVEGKTENLQVISIVGRYLEHSRIYCFGAGEEERLYIASADMMTRNTERRVEVACPIYDPEVRAKLHAILNIALRDTVKARILQQDGTYWKKDSPDPIDSQQFLMEQAEAAAQEMQTNQESKGLLQRIKGLLGWNTHQ